MADIRVIAREPHPVGSPANARVRDYLLTRLRALGLQPQVQAGVVEGTRTENVLAVLPGRDRTLPAVLVMAHYDSRIGSPGAADDAAGVASILETLRAMQASSRERQRDVIALLTDGEEKCLCGAKLFMRSPLARRVGVAINLEARGAAGRAHMFETGPGNARLIGTLARTVGSSSAQSLAGYVYDLMPNDTDFTEPKRAGVPGLNFAFIGDQAAYHTPLATPDRLNQGSLQHLGEQGLAIIAALAGDAARSFRGERDSVYGDLYGRVLVHYPVWAGWLIWAAAAALTAVAAQLVRHRDGLGSGVLVGALRTLGAVLLTAGALHLLNRLVLSGADRGGQAAAVTHALPILAGYAAILATALLVAFAGLRRPAETWIGALALGLLVAGALQAVAPETAPVVAWPVLLGAAAALAAGFLGERGALPAAAIAGVLGLGWIGGLLLFLHLGVGLFLPEALALGALLIPPVMAPLLGGEGEPKLRRVSPSP